MVDFPSLPCDTIVCECVHVCVVGTTRLLDMARQYSVQNFVYASSSSVYGCSDRQVLTEADAVEKPVSPYAATKKACEVELSPLLLLLPLDWTAALNSELCCAVL